ncbi:MAG TPA: ABC transporter substrate-binding protein [Streptosporangiaceae bacterium]|jgi:peptide/nickel transport system substrate-binding protein|nr:ABC transporter substrate-binding protein [Streptosporangiaceae bacterium]
MRKRSKAFASGVGLVALATAIAACGGSSSSSGSSGSSGSSSGSKSLDSGTQGINPGSGSPKSGGTLYMLGQGDVDYMDYNISYYSIGYLGQRMWVRGLYAYPATPGKTTSTEPDLATGMPVVSNGGKTYTITLRSGVDWNTSPARQVTAADAVLGLKRACNPVQPFGGLPDFETLISGYSSFCAGFAKAGSSAPAIKSYIDSHNISGVTASGQTLTINLVHAASYFTGMLTLDAFNPAPVESLNYVPASAAAQQHVYSDGPYEVQSYTPARQITYVRNPDWKASTDPIRKAYVNKIVVSETGNQASIQQQLETNSASASMEWDAFPPLQSVAGLIKQMQSGLNQNFNLGPTLSSNPYLVFNTVSPNNSSALAKTEVRQALSYGISRAHLTQVINPVVNPPLTHILPPGINGSSSLPSSYNPYPYNPTKAKQLLAAAGASNLSMTLLYRPDSTESTAVAQATQSDLAKIGVKVKLLSSPSADFYTKYLEVPSVAKRGVWDIAVAGWAPDWYTQGSLSFFGPLFSGAAAYPPVGSNFGFYNNSSVNSLITQASQASSQATADADWVTLDQDVMKDAPIFPITAGLQPNYHASYVHNAVYVPGLQQFDPTNVWLSNP